MTAMGQPEPVAVVRLAPSGHHTQRKKDQYRTIQIPGKRVVVIGTASSDLSARPSVPNDGRGIGDPGQRAPVRVLREIGTAVYEPGDLGKVSGSTRLIRRRMTLCCRPLQRPEGGRS